jgi:protein SCO1/2
MKHPPQESDLVRGGMILGVGSGVVVAMIIGILVAYAIASCRAHQLGGEPYLGELPATGRDVGVLRTSPFTVGAEGLDDHAHAEAWLRSYGRPLPRAARAARCTMMRRLALALPLALAAAPAAAQPARPPILRDVGVDDHTGARIPLDLRFTDAAGRRIQLAELFAGGKPVVLVLAYLRCKMLCSVVLQATTEAVRAMPLEIGRDYRLVTVSIDPSDDSAAAAVRRNTLLQRIGRAGEPDRWTFLIGAERPIRALADSLGFHYAWDPRTEQFAHPAAVFVLEPDGTIARTLQGVALDPIELAATIRLAAAGRTAPGAIEQAVLSCFHFDPAGRAHREAIRRYLQIGGAAICLMLATALLLLFGWERRLRRRP